MTGERGGGTWQPWTQLASQAPLLLGRRCKARSGTGYSPQGLQCCRWSPVYEAGDINYKANSRLSLLSARSVVTFPESPTLDWVGVCVCVCEHLPTVIVRQQKNIGVLLLVQHPINCISIPLPRRRNTKITTYLYSVSQTVCMHAAKIAWTANGSVMAFWQVSLLSQMTTRW